jgi:4-hydroxy-2-oxoheptanedioate aldolase
MNWQKLKDGQVVLGVSLTFSAPGMIEHFGAGWDWVWIDGQHGQMDYRTLQECVRIADAMGIPPVVRVPGHEYGIIGPVLDMRPAGVMVPMVDTAEQAKQVVDAVRYPPLGKRSYGGRRIGDLEGRDYFKTTNQDLLLMAQIETPEAVTNAEAIAATPGVDALFFGADDLKVRWGIPMNTAVPDSDQLSKAMEKTARAAKNAGKYAGCVAVAVPTLSLAMSQGYLILAGGGDVVFFRDACSKRLKELRDAIGANQKR